MTDKYLDDKKIQIFNYEEENKSNTLLLMNTFLKFSIIDKQLYYKLDEKNKMIFILFLLKRSHLSKKLKRMLKIELIEKKVLNNNINFQSTCNVFSLLETILNRIFRKCFDSYLKQLNMIKLENFAGKTGNKQKNVNKVFWFMFYKDCLDNEEIQIPNFNYFYKDVAFKKISGRKNRNFFKLEKDCFKFLNVVLRYKKIKKWIKFFRKNKTFIYYSNQIKKKLFDEYLNPEMKTFFDRKGAFDSFRLQENILCSYNKLMKFQIQTKSCLDLEKIKSNLKNVNCPFFLDDYIEVFKLF